jgi:hypothetical protein
MNQSVIVKDVTLANLVAKAEGVLGRKLETMEHAMMEYAVEEIRLGVANLVVNQ